MTEERDSLVARRGGIPRGPDTHHPIAILPDSGRILVEAGGRVIADTRAGLLLAEAGYPLVPYIPRPDVDMSLLCRAAHMTFCPYKGQARYFDIAIPGDEGPCAAWTYETPHRTLAAIAGHLAFYPDRVRIRREG